MRTVTIPVKKTMSLVSVVQMVKAYDKLLTQYNREVGLELTLVCCCGNAEQRQC